MYLGIYLNIQGFCNIFILYKYLSISFIIIIIIYLQICLDQVQ